MKPSGRARAASEGLAGQEVAPAALLEAAEGDAPDADALQAEDGEADGLAHAADLALHALLEDELELVGVHPADPGRTEGPSVEHETVAEEGEAPVVERAGDPDEVLLLDLRALTGQELRDPAGVKTMRPWESMSRRPAGASP